MKRLICMAMLVCAARGFCEVTPEVKAALDAVPAYEFGKDRSALTVVENACMAAGNDAAKRAELAAPLLEIAKAKGTRDGRQAALRYLGIVAGKAEVDGLASLLGDKEMGDAALWALERDSDAAVVDALVKALGDASAERKLAIVEVLGRRKDPKAVTAIAGVLAAPDLPAAKAAAKALGMLGGSAACAALQAARGNSSKELADALTDGCLRCAESLLAENPASAFAEFSVFAGGGYPGHVRAAAVRGMIEALPDKAFDMVTSAFKSGTPDLEELALMYVRTSKEKKATETFAGMLGGLAPRLRISTIQALADRHDVAAGPAILAQVGNEDPGIHMAALVALGKCGAPEALPVLLDKASNGSREEKIAARESLSTLAGDDVDKKLAEIALKADSKERVAALSALASRHASGTTKSLRELSEDQDAEVRDGALELLRTVGSEDDLEFLIGRLPKAQEAGREGMAQAIVAIAQREVANGNKATPILGVYEKTKDPAMRALWINVLGRVGRDTSLDSIKKASGDTDAGVRLAAINAMGAWPTSGPLETLHGLIKPDAPAEERDAAFRGYVKQLNGAKELAPADRFARYKEALGAAKTVQERRSVLAGLSGVPSREAFELAANARKDGELAAEATTATLELAKSLAGAYPELAREQAMAIMAETKNEAQKRDAGQVIKMLGAFQGYITAWQYAGPYAVTGKPAMALFNMPFPPEEKPESVKWSLAPVGSNPEAPWVVSLAEILGGVERVAYLRTSIASDKEQDAVLELGTNDGCKAWWNGKLIKEFNAGRTLNCSEDKLPVHLAAKNTLLIAVYQQGGDWSACARLTAPDGGKLEGVKAGLPE